MQLTARGAEALAALLDAGLPAAAFKGLALVARPGCGSLRSMGDVDLLVAEEALEDAIESLAAVGFHLDISGSLEDYKQFIRSAPHFSGNCAVPLIDANGHSLDLHWGFGAMCGPALDPAAVHSRSVAAEWFGASIRCVSRTDGMLLAAHHAMRENFTPAVTARNLFDIDVLRRDEDGEAIQPEIFAGAGAPATALAACTMLLDGFAGCERSGALSEGLDAALDASALRQARDLVAVFEGQIDAPALNRDVLHLMHGTTLRELLVTAFMHPSRNRRLMADMEGLPTSTRLRSFLADLCRVKREDLRLYRSLARLKRLRVKS
jgi:hypothetical protein